MMPADVAAIVDGLVVRHQRRALAKAITCLESSRREDEDRRLCLVEALMPHAGRSRRIGISGAPGVGKSTLIEQLGLALIAAGHRVAVLAIDPSSPLRGGSILGDKTRMPQLAAAEQAFVRPSPSKGSLGGVARRTREAIVACEAWGCDRIIVETVGVGQSEVMVASMVDCFCVLHLPGSGDELQGIKKGLLELADVIAVTKADGALRAAAERAQADLRQALHLIRRTAEDGIPVLLASALEGEGIIELGRALDATVERREASGALAQQRRDQALRWLDEEIVALLHERLAGRNAARGDLATLRERVGRLVLPASVAAARFLAEHGFGG